MAVNENDIRFDSWSGLTYKEVLDYILRTLEVTPDEIEADIRNIKREDEVRKAKRLLKRLEAE